MISSCVFTAICVSLALSEELGQLFQSFIISFCIYFGCNHFTNLLAQHFRSLLVSRGTRYCQTNVQLMSLLSMYQPQKKWNILSWWPLAISLEAKADFFCDMRRLAGEKILCGSEVMLLLLVTQLHRVAMRLYQALRPTKLFSTDVGNCWIGFIIPLLDCDVLLNSQMWSRIEQNRLLQDYIFERRRNTNLHQGQNPFKC